MNLRIMLYRRLRCPLGACFAILLFQISLVGCGQEPHSSSSSTEQGAIGFQLVLEKRSPVNENGGIEWYQVDADDRVDHVSVCVYDGETLLKEGGPWNWSAGSGTIEGIQAGSGRDVVVLVCDADQHVLYRGETSGIDITADRTNDAGIIKCTDFIPVLTLPLDGATVTSNAFDNQWEAVSGASEYNLVISKNEDLSDPLDDIIISPARYRRSGLAPSTTFYWRVAAVDEYGNQSLWSDIWHFTTGSTINQIPSANIQSPSNNDSYNLGEDVAFSGTGVDDEDGELTGNALVWTSDLDGQIGTGDTFTKNDLSEGTHRITLSATDSDGAVGEASIHVTIIGSGAPVADAGANQRIAVGETVHLDGSASRDPNDDPLTYSWSFTSIPAGSTAQLTGDTTQEPSFIADLAGSYVVSLVVNDGSQDSTADSVTVTAGEDGNPPEPTYLLNETGTITQNGQSQYFQVTVAADQPLFVNLSYDYRQNYYLYVKFGSPPDRNDFDASSNTGDDQLAVIHNTQAGIYYIMVYSSSHIANYSGDYTLTATNALEALSVGTQIASTISNLGQKHYYQISCADGQDLFVKLEYDYRQNYYIYVSYDTPPTQNNFDASSTTGDDQLAVIQNTRAGLYYVMVYSSSHIANYSGDYTISARSSLESMTLNTPINSSISNLGQKHYYQIETTAGQNLFINLGYDYRQNYYLYSSYGTPPTQNNFDFSSTTGDDELISIENTRAGVYYIMIYSSSHIANYSGDYTITATNSF